MHIYHIIYDDIKNPWCGGGGAKRAFEINKRIAKNHAIKVFTGKFPNSKNEIIDGVTYIRIGSSKSYLLSRITFSFLAPYYVIRSEADIVVNDFSVFSPVFCEFFTKKTVINCFYHFVGKHSFKKYLIFGIIPFIVEKILLRTSKNFITISPSVTEILQKRAKQVKKIKCIYTGISDNIFNSGTTDEGYIAYIGRIDIYMKGIDILLDAFSQLKDKNIKLKIAGKGKTKDIDNIMDRIENLNLKNSVDFLGAITEEEKKTFLSSSMFVVMPSRFEGWGIVAIEAQACGKAVIGTNIPGLRDAIKDGETGILIEPDNPSALRGAMQSLIEDTEQRLKLGREGRHWAKNFKWDNIANEQLQFYKEVINGGE